MILFLIGFSAAAGRSAGRLLLPRTFVNSPLKAGQRRTKSQLAVLSLMRGLTFTMALSLVGPAAMAQASFGLSGGSAGSVTSEGLAGFSESKFKRSTTAGAGFGYRFSNGATVGIRAERVRLNLHEQDAVFGNLEMRPLIASIGYQHMPSKRRGFGGHVQLGGGIALTKFQKGPTVTELERDYGVQVLVSTRKAPVFEFGGGIDYFISPNISLTTDFRLLASNVKTQWAVVGTRTVPVSEFEKFFASNGQVLGGIRFWLK